MQLHVAQRPLSQRALFWIGCCGRIRHAVANATHLLRADAPGDLGLQGIAVHRYLSCEMRTFVAGQAAPMGHGLLPTRALRRKRSMCEILQRGVVRSYEAVFAREFDRHVADRQAALDGHRCNGRASIFHCVVDAPLRTEAPDQGENQIFGVHARAQATFAVHTHAARSGLGQSLRGQYVFRFAGAYAPGQRAYAPHGAGVAVAAHHRGSRKCDALFRHDHVCDTLARVVVVDEMKAPVARGAPRGLDHDRAAGRW